MSEDYSSHADYMASVSEEAEARYRRIELAFQQAFKPFIETRSVEVVLFSAISATDLGRIIAAHPVILKPLLAISNIAGRAIERDLGIKNVDTYRPRITGEQAAALAGYIKPFLPAYVEIPALCHLDRVAYIDKEVRKSKGRWEHTIIKALNQFGRLGFKKRMFEVNGEKFELDAAGPATGAIEVGVDVKRIEARRDIHKRSDEIVNKGSKLKAAYPQAKFGAVIYYPFIEERVNVQSRLESEAVDAIVFAAESEQSVRDAVRMLLAKLGIAK